MSADYIVVSATNAELTKIALGMLGAKYLTDVYQEPYAYPMPGPTFFIWDGKPNVAGDQVAFGPLPTGIDPDFGTWCLGKELEIDDNGLEVSITIPSSAQSLDTNWFPPPPSIPPSP